jgi:fucose 4-O-acetylase-like acetyltransferase
MLPFDPHIILLICNKHSGIDLVQNSYENPLFFLIVSFVGWQFLYEMAYFIKKQKKISNIIACAGQNTMAVIVLHFLCFKVVSCMGVLINGEPLFLIAAFPILYCQKNWWLLYSAVGLVIPIYLSLIWKKLKIFMLGMK